MLPGLLIPKALVRIAPGTSIVVKIKQHRAHRAEMTLNLDNPDLGKIMLERVVMRRIASPPLLCRTRCLTPFGEISPPSHEDTRNSPGSNAEVIKRLFWKRFPARSRPPAR